MNLSPQSKVFSCKTVGGDIIRKVKIHFGRSETYYDFIDLRG